ncbi:MAG: SDR family NAD(P)-dependent oxidoreductase [Candidatus Omnitrophota bacterium]|nr:MAG: SDR family NAD(P)-dependent oxidoreductase [Candidatus Omnitrophota bacterium]
MYRNKFKKKKVFIITGASRGIGRALSAELARSDSTLFLIARNKIMLEKVIEEIGQNTCAKSILFDLRKTKQLEKIVEDIFMQVDFKEIESITLINNAGIISPITLAGGFKLEDAVDNLKVNCIVPIILSDIFIRKTKDFKGKKIILNISSDAAKTPKEGLSLYCSSKSAVEMFSQCVSREQSRYKYGVTIYTFSPGAVDTHMFSELTKKAKEDLPNVDSYVLLSNSGSLKHPRKVAKEINRFIREKLDT